MNQSAQLNAAILRTPAEWNRQDVKERQRMKTAREGEKADGTITKLKEEAGGKTGEGGVHCEWMGLWIENDCK